MITLNGQSFSIPSSCHDLPSLLDHLALTPGHVIVDHNGVIIKGSEATQSFNAGDTIDIIHFMGGG